MIRSQVLSIAITITVTITLTLAIVFVYLKFYADKHKSQTVTEQHMKTYRLLDVMHELQRYSTKLYFAGTAKNQKLASWYSWKLERAILDIKERRIEPYAYNGWDAAELVKMLDIPISDLNTTLKNEQWKLFEDRFDTLMHTCNACHIAAEHHFVIVKAPDGEPPQNQKFN